MLCLSQRNAGSKQGFAFLSLSPELICISEPCTALLPKINPALTQARCCAGVTPTQSPPSVLAQPCVPGWDPGDIGVSPSSASSPCSLQCTSLSWAPRRVQLPRSFPRACPRWRYLWTPPRSRCGLSPAASPPGQLETDRKKDSVSPGLLATVLRSSWDPEAPGSLENPEHPQSLRPAGAHTHQLPPSPT